MIIECGLNAEQKDCEIMVLKYIYAVVLMHVLVIHHMQIYENQHAKY